MKKTVLILCACLAICVGNAQNLPQGLGIQVGFTMPTMRLNAPEESGMPKDSLVNKTQMNGVKVGLVYDGTIIKGFGASIGVNYTFAGEHGTWTPKNDFNPLIQERVQTIYNQLEVFVDWQYKFEIAKETYIILYTGPTIQSALTLNKHFYEKDESPAGSGMITKKGMVSCFDYEDNEKIYDYHRLNVTWGVGAGFQYQRYYIRGGYDFGLMNPYKETNFGEMEMGYADRRTRGRLDQWNIRLGIYFWYR